MSKKQKITNNIKVPNKDLEILKKHFSHCFTKNGEFDFEKFKQELSKNEIDFYKESYGLDWLGKSYARLLASDEATTLLKEDEEFNQKDENKNSQNLLIKGDNLEVLKHLSNAYYEEIKMIYIDPPYNTGSDGFVYQDDRKFTVDEFRQLAGVDEDKAKRILSFVDSKSNSHSAWLTFMYPRLYIAKQLLKDDGVIFVSIDDNEVAQLRLLMDEVFGEENFVGEIIWRGGKRNAAKWISNSHEYMLFYAKNLPYISLKDVNWKVKKQGLENIYKQYNKLLKEYKTDYSKITEHLKKWFKELPESHPAKDHKHYCNVDKKGVYFASDISRKDGGKWDIVNPITGNILNPPSRGWAFPNKEEMGKAINEDLIDFSNDDGVPTFKRYLKDNETQLIDTVIYKDRRAASKSFRKLMGNGIFDFPKDVGILKYFIDATSENKDIILDFFAGSGTTGDAVMQLNAEDGGNRKYILVQLPEPIDPKKNKTAYEFVNNELGVEEPTIFEITKERLIRAAKKIKEETIKTKISEKQKEINELETKLDIDGKNEKIKQLKTEIKALEDQDLGFKIFETKPIWEDYNFEADELTEQTKLFDDSKLTEEDLKALLVTWKTYDGIPLIESLQEIDLNGYTGHYGKGDAGNKLYLINKGFKTENLKTLLEKIDSDKKFNPTSIIAFGYRFESKNLREIAENIKSYANKKNIDIDFITRY